MGWWSTPPGNAVSQPDGYDETQGKMSDVAWVSGDGTVVSILKKIAGAGGPSAAVTIADGADVTQGAVADAVWSGSGNGTVIALLKKIASAGGSAVSVADGADVAQGTTTDLSSANTVIGILKAIKAAVTGTLTVAAHAVTQSGTWTVQPGNTANTTAWKVDNSAVTQPVSGTVAVSGTVTVDSELTTADLDTGAGTDTRAVVGLVGAASGGAVQVQATAGGAVKSDITTIAGTAPTTVGKIDVKAADGDVFVRQATAANLNATAVGPTAPGASLTANPLTTGARAATAPPTAVANGQVVNAQSDIYGKTIVRESLREDLGNQQTSIASSTSETTIVTADATYKLDLYALILTNTSATGTKVTIKDATGGTTRFIFWIPANETRGFQVSPSGAHKQAAANANWTATCGTSVANVEITAMTTRSL